MYEYIRKNVSIHSSVVVGFLSALFLLLFYVHTSMLPFVCKHQCSRKAQIEYIYNKYVLMLFSVVFIVFYSFFILLCSAYVYGTLEFREFLKIQKNKQSESSAVVCLLASTTYSSVVLFVVVSVSYFNLF